MMYDSFCRTIGILGAGSIGAGIAQVALNNGLTVVLKDTNKEDLVKGVVRIEKGLLEDVKRNKLTM